MNSTSNPLITVPLGGKAHRLARQWASEAMQLASSPSRRETGKRVYLNTLAAYAVDSYLRWQAYGTSLIQGDLADPLLRSRLDVADLAIPGGTNSGNW